MLWGSRPVSKTQTVGTEQDRREGKQWTYCILIPLVLLEQSRVNETKAEDKTGNTEDMTLRSANACCAYCKLRVEHHKW